MTDLIYLFIINTLFIYGVNIITRKDMLFGPIFTDLRNWAEKKDICKKVNFALKPLIDCPPCMASIWGTVFFLLFVLVSYPAVYLLALPVYVFSLSGFVFLIGEMMPCCDD